MRNEAEPILRAQAKRVCRWSPRGVADLDDLLQEGRIAVWRAGVSAEEEPALFTLVARRQMIDWVRGQYGRRGRRWGLSTTTRSLEEPVRAQEGQDITLGDTLSDGEDHADDVHLRFDVARILRELRPRDRLYAALVSLGWQQQEVAALFEVSPSYMAQMRHRIALEVRDALEPLL